MNSALISLVTSRFVTSGSESRKFSATKVAPSFIEASIRQTYSGESVARIADAVASAQSRCAQRVREPRDLLVGLAVGEHRPVPAHQAGCVRLVTGVQRDPVPDRET